MLSALCSTFAMPHFFERARHVIVKNGWFVAGEVNINILKITRQLVDSRSVLRSNIPPTTPSTSFSLLQRGGLRRPIYHRQNRQKTLLGHTRRPSKFIRSEQWWGLRLQSHSFKLSST